MKTKLLRAAYLILCFMVVGLSVKAQSSSPSQTQYFVPQLFPRSPVATAIEKYGTYQVNEFTGLPDISIPLYTVEAGGLQVPISLSYHASGVKVTDVASFAGLGWSVSAGGQVSRRVMGLPDDVTYGYLNGYMYQPGTYSTGTYAGLYYLENVSNGTYDSKPDIYSYDFPGHSGKFFLDGRRGQNFVPRTVPYAPLNIIYKLIPYSYDDLPPNSGLTKFDITDEHGNYYTFGNGATDITISSSGGKPSGVTSGSAWKLTGMVSQNRRDTISFSYKTDTIYYPLNAGEIYTVIDQVINNESSYVPSYSTTPITPGNVNIVHEELPSQINFKNGRVVFDLDATVRQDINQGTPSEHAYGLKDIKVYQYNYRTKTMELQKTIVFYKSYFPPLYNQRLRLDSIQILDKAGSTIQHYRFDYNQSIAMPSYTAYSQDYWGYNNGQPNTAGLTPEQVIDYQPYSTSTVTHVTIGSAIRTCDSGYMQALVLTGIHYPTGGYTAFTYQTNQYMKGDTLELAGGLRVKTISSYDGASSIPIVKTYVYNSARPNFLLDYSYFVTAQNHRWYYLFLGSGVQLGGSEVVRTFANNPHCDLEGWDGATVVYPSVTEYIGTPGTNIGRTDYTFTDQADSLSRAYQPGNLVYNSMFYVRGHLASKKEYIHLASGAYQPVKYTTNTYSTLPYTYYDTVGMAQYKINYNEGPVGENPLPPGYSSPDDTYSFPSPYPYYHILSDDNYLKTTTTHIYDTNDTTKYTNSTVRYTYDDPVHQQIIAVTDTDSKGNIHITNNKYVYDYLNGGTTTHNTVLDSMINRNMYAEVIEKTDNLINLATSVTAVTGAQLNYYQFGSIANTIIPLKIFKLNVAQPLTDFTPSSVVSGNLTGDTRYSQMITFDHYDSQNNITQYTPRNATPTTIMWDYLQDLPTAQVKNSIITNTAYTSFEADGNGGWIYSGASVFDPTAPTGTSVYSLSAGNITSPVVATSMPYVLSFWNNNTGTAVVTPYLGSPLTGTPLNTVNGWTYYEYQVPTGTSQVAISGTTSIDELRLYPVAAQMTTYAYDPSGLRSISDTKGTNSYFTYDYFQRLKNIKDWNSDIVKNYGYHTYDQIFGNQVQTNTFTRTNCPVGYTPGALTYTVPANKYYSSTQASADADAIYDMNTNGQIKANINCHCTAGGIAFVIHNETPASFQVLFSGGVAPYNDVLPGDTTLYIPPNATPGYTLTINTADASKHTYTLGVRTPVHDYNVTFNSVIIATGSSDLTLTIN